PCRSTTAACWRRRWRATATRLPTAIPTTRRPAAAATGARRRARHPGRATIGTALPLPALPDAQVCVALSGGLDSTVLLHRLASEPEVRVRGLRAWRVHP